MREARVRCLSASGFHRMHYYEWGDHGNPRVVICVHGLTRTGRDFDALAQALSGEFRVVCPDIAGRGQSDWLGSAAEYTYPQYMADGTTLLARVAPDDASEIAWVGTSMGGILGMLMAALPGTPIRKLVVNDAGTRVPKAALERIGRYAGKDPRFPTLDALEAHLRVIAAGFGSLTDAQWRHLATHCAREYPDGTCGYGYDPAIAAPLQGELADIDLSAYWDAIRCPTLLLRGADSDLLLRESAEAMARSGPKARLVEFAGVGHAPMLMNEEQIAVVREFLISDVGRADTGAWRLP